MELLEARRLNSHSWSIIDVEPNVFGAHVYAAGPGDTLVGEYGGETATVWQIGRGGTLSSQWLRDPGTSSWLEDVNSAGATVGISFPLGSLTTHGVLWQPAKHGGYARTDLGAMTGPSEIFSDASRIADNGVIAGTASIPGVAQHPAVAWVSRDGTANMIDLISARPDKASELSYANDVSSAGLIVGIRGDRGGNVESDRATVWTLGRHDRVNESTISTLGGKGNNATAVNDSGMVAGSSATSIKLSVTGQAAWMAYVSSRSGSQWQVTSLGTLRHEEQSVAQDINDSGVIVGRVSHRQFSSRGKILPDDPTRAVLWEPDGHGNFSIVPLDNLIPRDSGWTALTQADRINNDGTILGRGWKGGAWHTFLLVPAHRAPIALDQKSVSAASAIPFSLSVPITNSTPAVVVRKAEDQLFRQELPLL